MYVLQPRACAVGSCVLHTMQGKLEGYHNAVKVYTCLCNVTDILIFNILILIFRDAVQVLVLLLCCVHCGEVWNMSFIQQTGK